MADAAAAECPGTTLGDTLQGWSAWPAQEASSRSCPTQPHGWPLSPRCGLGQESGTMYGCWNRNPYRTLAARESGTRTGWLLPRGGGQARTGGGGTMTQPAREPAPRECRARLGPGASLRHTCSLSAWKVSELGTEPRSDSKLCILSILTCFSPAGQALPPPTSHTSAGLSVVPDGAGRLEGPSEPGELAVSMFSKSELLLALSGRS